jgi:hypothetical protein
MTQDIQQPWLNIARRFQSIASKNKGFNKGMAVITIRVLIDEDGVPQFWSEPEMTKIEPKRCKEDIINLLSNSH